MLKPVSLCFHVEKISLNGVHVCFNRRFISAGPTIASQFVDSRYSDKLLCTEDVEMAVNAGECLSIRCVCVFSFVASRCIPVIAKWAEGTRERRVKTHRSR